MGTCFVQFRSVVSATIKSDPRSDLDAVALAAPLFIKHHHNTAVLRLTRVRALPYARTLPWPSRAASRPAPQDASIFGSDPAEEGRCSMTSSRSKPRPLPTVRNGFACAYPSVCHEWIFMVLEVSSIPPFIVSFPRWICSSSDTHVAHAGTRQGSLPMARVVTFAPSCLPWL